ncbi:glycosyltransferase [Cereibacter sphaeroides]|uniref:glycosyltransferase n=1 Tax=Cereibacter sphaeroides TaxID=1063 RepID=UPI003AEF1791
MPAPPRLLPLARRSPPPAAEVAAAPPPAEALGVMLLREGQVAPHRIMKALSRGAGREAPLAEMLLAEGALDEAEVCEILARRSGMAVLHPAVAPPDPRLVDRLGVRTCLREALLPSQRIGDATLVAASTPETFLRQGPRLQELFGRVIPALASRSEIEAAVVACRAQVIGAAAEARVAAPESCRDWRPARMRQLTLGAALGLAAGLALAPQAVLLILTLWTLITLVCSTLLRIAAAIAALRRAPPLPPAPTLARLPMVSIIVALYHEEDIAGRLVARLGRLDYPRDRLEILLVVEACDRRTRAALDAARLPPWMRIVVSPAGQIRTKPRALNVALDHCRGSIIGVYDAEDSPAPDQIRRIVEGFSRRGPQVACLQGQLDYYNPRTNWLSRCFTIEYAAWWRLMLPGVDRLGLAVPLGGTTLFFRRAALEDLGAWDAHNVTEDADLGIRLARHGYRTELVATVTEEEANCRAIPWIKQRSRWLKGFMMTWAVHMRDPALLWRQLGPRRFAGFQVMFLGSLSQTVLAPLLWSFWLLALGLPHPVAATLPAPAIWAMVALLLLAESVAVVTGILALRQTRHRLNPLWVLTMHLYNPLATFAAYKALWELLTAPFYWDKTRHGLFDPPVRLSASAARPHRP